MCLGVSVESERMICQLYLGKVDNIVEDDVPTRAGEPANFLAASPLTFFFKRLRLLIFSPSGPGPWYFFSSGSGSGSKGPKKTAPAPDYWFSSAKYSFPRKLERYNFKKYKTSKIIGFFNHKNLLFYL